MNEPLEVDQVDYFETIHGKLQAAYDEIQKLSQKDPNGSLNAFKLKIINSVVAACNSFLGSENEPMAGFSEFESEQLPSNSDVLFVLGQYLSGLEKFRASHITNDLQGWYWVVNSENPRRYRTAPPKKLSSK